MSAPAAIAELVQRFRDHHEVYTSGAYNETQLRRDFLDPFFAALGWDVHNSQGYAEAYREVIHEDAVKVGAFTKAPDYYNVDKTNTCAQQAICSRKHY
ncbi:MAG: hypothetical protein JW832_10345 [Deltaproteobacteria bacterium]|nr:hypothetical protein [Deltaproteobacteria bacterium]